MYPELVLLLGFGYIAGVVAWPWRRHLRSGPPGNVMFAVLWPLILLARMAVLARPISR